MNTEQTNRVTMFKTTVGVLDANSSVWNAMAPLATAVQQLEAKIAAIDEAAQKQETPTTGAAADKASARHTLEDSLFLTCEALGVLGTTSNDNELVALTSLTPASLDRLGDQELANRATTVLEKTNTKKTDLARFQVTQANIDELSQALEDFKGIKERPRLATATRVAQTTSLADLIREANDILRNQIDRLVNLFRRSNPQFVAVYRSARVIVNRPASHATPKGPAGPVTPPPPPSS